MLTLLRQHHPLAEASEQRRILEDASLPVPFFHELVEQCGAGPFTSRGVQVLQVNVGKVCNQTCQHCHVDAGPDRRESMSAETAEACLAALDDVGIQTLDITGGAPEMNPNFRRLVEGARQRDRRVIDRCNLTILLAPGFSDLPRFLADHEVEIIASLPCYQEENCDRQRGVGVFEKSITALQMLNELGYGKPETGLPLSLVYNPTGPQLAPDQQQLEGAYREQLKTRFGIEFTRLYTITNMPISRFLHDLLQQGKYPDYLEKLVQAFNPHTLDGVMCRTMLSVDWEGMLYDCDFNQMLDLPISSGRRWSIRDYDAAVFGRRQIVTGRHCLGCTAGAGSSCQGALEPV